MIYRRAEVGGFSNSCCKFCDSVERWGGGRILLQRFRKFYFSDLALLYKEINAQGANVFSSFLHSLPLLGIKIAWERFMEWLLFSLIDSILGTLMLERLVQFIIEP